MAVPDLRLLSSSEGRPHLVVLDLAARAVGPSPVPVDNAATGLHGCSVGEGWIAVHSSEDVWLVPTPLAGGRAIRIAQSSTFVPGHDGRTAWLDADDPPAVVEYDCFAREVRRQIALPDGATLAADVSAGLVVSSGRSLELCDREGRRLRTVGRADRVVASHGSLLLCAGDSGSDCALLDVDSGRETRIACPPGGKWGSDSGRFSPDGRLLALDADFSAPDRYDHPLLVEAAQRIEEVRSSGRDLTAEDLAPLTSANFKELEKAVAYQPVAHRLALVSCETGQVDLVEGEFDNFAFELVWSDDGRWIVFDAPFQSRGLWLCDIEARRLERLKFPRNPPAPMLDVSSVERFGDLSIERLRAMSRPARTGPLSATERDELMERERARVGEAPDAEAAIRLRSCIAPGRVPVGVSRLGGRPDLPRAREWPSVDGVPLPFLAQLRCDELHAACPSVWPRDQGLLVVFAGLEPEAVHVEVVADDGLSRRAWPAGLPKDERYGHALAVPEPALTVPGEGLSDAGGARHQLGGHPSTIQGDGTWQGRRLVLTIDSDGLIATAFADGGRLHIWGPEGVDLPDGLADCVLHLDSY